MHLKTFLIRAWKAVKLFSFMYLGLAYAEENSCLTSPPDTQDTVFLSEKALQSYYDAISAKLDQLKKKIDALERQQRDFMTLVSDITIQKEEGLPKEISDFEHIQDLIERNQKDLAKDQIGIFAQKYPHTERTAYLYYLLAEIYRQNQAYDAALESYERILNLYPEHPKSAEALYKMAQINQFLHLNDISTYQYKILLKKYPQSPLCEMAKKELIALKKEKFKNKSSG